MGVSIFDRTGLYILMLCKEGAAKLDASWQALRVFPLVATFPQRPSIVGSRVILMTGAAAVGVNCSGELTVVAVGGISKEVASLVA